MSLDSNSEKAQKRQVAHTLLMLARGLRASITIACSHLLQEHDDSDWAAAGFDDTLLSVAS